MTYSSSGKYRGTSGTLTIGGGNLTFSRMDGMISKKQRLVITIPADAIVNTNVEGMISKKLVVLVDGAKVPGIPRHEFIVPDPYQWINAIRNEINISTRQQPQPLPQPHPQPAHTQIIKEKEITTREVVKIRCQYCGNLFDEVRDKCPSCGGR